MDIATISLLLVTAGILVFSFMKDRKKTKTGLVLAKGMFINMAPELFGILALIGLFLAMVPPDTIQSLLGGSSPLLSTIYGAGIGTVAIIPAFVAFPLSASLVDMGAHLVAVAAFITTLTMVGFLTAPIEIEHFGKRFTLVRNVLSFTVAILIAVGVGVLLSI
ncbi:MAG: permease [Candidatus Thermoplasmatota archaeon]|nr:permease [Candidatus Thermoplasmatota archaeon]